MGRANSLEKTLRLGKIKGQKRWDDRRWDGWVASASLWIWVWANPGRQWRTGKPSVLQSVGSQRVRYDWAIELQWDRGKKILCAENYKPLMKQIKGDINQWRKISCSWIESINIVKMTTVPKQSTNLMQSLLNYQWHFSHNQKKKSFFLFRNTKDLE